MCRAWTVAATSWQRTMAQLWADFDQVANPLTRVELDLATA
jgi:hypothetical protein